MSNMNAKPLTGHQLQKAQERRRILEAVLPLLERGASMNRAAHKIGTSTPTLCRLLHMAPIENTTYRFSHLELCKMLVKCPLEQLAPGYHAPLPPKTKEETGPRVALD